MGAVRSLNAEGVQQGDDVRVLDTKAKRDLALSVVGVGGHDFDGVISLVRRRLYPPYCGKAAGSKLANDFVTAVMAGLGVPWFEPIADTYRMVAPNDIFLDVFDVVKMKRIAIGRSRRHLG
jgi:hypothetical protein